MHLVTFNASGHGSPGVIAGDSILDLGAAAAILPAAKLVPSSMRGLLEGGDAALDLVRTLRDQAMNANSSLKEQLTACGELLPKAAAKLLAPLAPGMILSGGMNYHAHLKEMNSPIPDPENVAITTTLNGTVMQSANTDDLVFSLRKLIEYYSQFYRFVPGDVITTGSPSGVGYGRNPKVFMKAGDTVEVKIDAIGALTNPISLAH